MHSFHCAMQCGFFTVKFAWQMNTLFQASLYFEVTRKPNLAAAYLNDSLHSLALYSSLAACAILISHHFDFSQDAFSKLRVHNFDKRRMKVAKRNCESTKALFKLTNYCDKAI